MMHHSDNNKVIIYVYTINDWFWFALVHNNDVNHFSLDREIIIFINQQLQSFYANFNLVQFVFFSFILSSLLLVNSRLITFVQIEMEKWNEEESMMSYCFSILTIDCNKVKYWKVWMSIHCSVFNCLRSVFISFVFLSVWYFMLSLSN